MSSVPGVMSGNGGLSERLRSSVETFVSALKRVAADRAERKAGV